jgi:hypothetical protein
VDRKYIFPLGFSSLAQVLFLLDLPINNLITIYLSANALNPKPMHSVTWYPLVLGGSLIFQRTVGSGSWKKMNFKESDETLNPEP